MEAKRLINGHLVFTRFDYNLDPFYQDLYTSDNGQKLIANPDSSGKSWDYTVPRFNSDRSKILLLSSLNVVPKQLNLFTLTLGQTIPVRIPSENRDFVNADWSPDDSRFVVSCTAADESIQIFILNPNGIFERQLTSTGENYNAMWSPLDDLIAFSSFPNPADRRTSHICLIGTDGNNFRQLTTASTYHDYPSWSPNGEWLVYRCGNHLQKININTMEIVDFPGIPNCTDQSPVWAGTEIVFASNRAHPGQEKFNLYLMSDQGGAITRLTNNELFEFPGDWYL